MVRKGSRVQIPKMAPEYVYAHFSNSWYREAMTHMRLRKFLKFVGILVLAFVFGVVVAVVQFYTQQSDCESNTALDQTDIQC